MNTKQIQMFTQFIRAKITRKWIPLFVSWALTNRCNCRCYYCREVKREEAELETAQIVAFIDALKTMGTMRIHFTGGEPLLRDDFAHIAEHANSRNISVGLATNGIFLPEKLNLLERNIDRVAVSFDGPKEIHEKVKGRGAHEAVLTALKMLKETNIELVLMMPLHKDNTNIPCVEYALEIARQYKAMIVFQPAVDYEHFLREGAAFFSPAVTDYRQVMDYIIKRKSSDKSKLIFNSQKVLHFLRSWPDANMLKDCPSGKIYWRIRTDGLFCSCGWMSSDAVEKDEFRKLTREKRINCAKCWCAPRLELAYLWNLDWQAIINTCGGNKR